MANFIVIKENDGVEFLLNLDSVVSIHPTNNQMTGSSCNVVLLNQKDGIPITPLRV